MSIYSVNRTYFEKKIPFRFHIYLDIKYIFKKFVALSKNLQITKSDRNCGFLLAVDPYLLAQMKPKQQETIFF